MTTMRAHNPYTIGHGPSLGLGAWLRSLPMRMWGTLITWQSRIAYRQRLELLDDHLLGDIGMDRTDAMREAAKPFWRA